MKEDILVEFPCILCGDITWKTYENVSPNDKRNIPKALLCDDCREILLLIKESFQKEKE